MITCKHHYVYAYESKAYDYDVDFVRDGYIECPLPALSVGVRVAFYQCAYCGKMLIMERVG